MGAIRYAYPKSAVSIASKKLEYINVHPKPDMHIE